MSGGDATVTRAARAWRGGGPSGRVSYGRAAHYTGMLDLLPTIAGSATPLECFWGALAYAFFARILTFCERCMTAHTLMTSTNAPEQLPKKSKNPLKKFLRRRR